jgi:cytochrome c biogenesis factor
VCQLGCKQQKECGWYHWSPSEWLALSWIDGSASIHALIMPRQESLVDKAMTSVKVLYGK